MGNDTPRLVILESPFAGKDKAEELKHKLYLWACIDDSAVVRGEAPFASHMMYPGPLNDKIPIERAIGINAGLAWAAVAERAVFYIDFGMSPGMRAAQERHRRNGLPCEYRNLPSAAILAILDRLKGNC